MRGQDNQTRLTCGWALLVMGALVFVAGLCTTGFQITELVNTASQDVHTGSSVDTGTWQDDGWDWSFDSLAEIRSESVEQNNPTPAILFVGTLIASVLFLSLIIRT